MNKIVIILVTLILVISENLNAQQWKSLDRQQKDSVIFNQRNKGNRYVGIGLGGGFLSGGWSGLMVKVEPVFGYYFFSRQLFAASFIFESAEINVEKEFMESQQYSIGGFYRYYLPERRTLTLFFGQAGLYGGKFFGHYYVDNIEKKTELMVFTLSFSGGISFPINKFNFELIVTYSYELINQHELDEFFTGKTLGMLNFSYTF